MNQIKQWIPLSIFALGMSVFLLNASVPGSAAAASPATPKATRSPRANGPGDQTTSVVAASAPHNERAKRLYYEPDTPLNQQEANKSQPALPARIGLKYKIVLKDTDGDVREVTERFRFSTGDSIRLVVESNIDGYLYIYHKGSSSRGVQLFPDPRINHGKNHIRRFTQYTIPSQIGSSRGWFKFDPKVGSEELFIFLSPKPIDDLVAVAPAVQGNELDEGGWKTVESLTGNMDKAGERDFYFESEHQDNESGDEEPCSAYVISRTPILIHHLSLRHGR